MGNNIPAANTGLIFNDIIGILKVKSQKLSFSSQILNKVIEELKPENLCIGWVPIYSTLLSDWIIE